MRVEIVRHTLPHAVDIWIDGEPDLVTYWIDPTLITEEDARRLELSMNANVQQ